MATVQIAAAKVVKTISGNNPMVLVLPEAASVTGKRGELVFLNSAGFVAETGADPTQILGLLAEDGHNDGSAGDSNIAVEIANADNIFEIHLSDSAGAGVATVAANRGAGLALFRDTTNSRVTAYDAVDNTKIRVRCIGHSAKDALGDTGGRLLCMFVGPFRQLDTTS